MLLLSISSQEVYEKLQAAKRWRDDAAWTACESWKSTWPFQDMASPYIHHSGCPFKALSTWIQMPLMICYYLFQHPGFPPVLGSMLGPFEEFFSPKMTSCWSHRQCSPTQPADHQPWPARALSHRCQLRNSSEAWMRQQEENASWRVDLSSHGRHL